MLKKILILILMVNFNISFGNVKGLLTNDLYIPIGDIRDLAFELHSSEIQNLVAEKIVTTSVTDLRVKYFWNKNNFDVDIINSKNINETTKEIILKEYKSIAKIILGDDFEKFLEGYEYEGEKKGVYVWVDPTGLKDISEIKIVKKDLETTVIQKKSTGTIRTIFKYQEYDWSNKKKVLTSVEKNIFEGVQSIKVESDLTYKEKNGRRLPDTMIVQTTHVLNQNKDDDYTRSIKVKYEFLNYHINTAEALRWFSTR